MNKKQKKMLVRIIIAAALMIILHFVPVKGVIRFLLYLIPYFVIGYDILRKAFKGIMNHQVFDENFLMAVATVGAIIVALSENGIIKGAKPGTVLIDMSSIDPTESRAIAAALFENCGYHNVSALCLKF